MADSPTNDCPTCWGTGTVIEDSSQSYTLRTAPCPDCSAPAPTGQRWVLHCDAMARCWRVVGKGPEGEPGERVSVVPKAEAEDARIKLAEAYGQRVAELVIAQDRAEAKLGAARELLQAISETTPRSGIAMLRPDLRAELDALLSEPGGE